MRPSGFFSSSSIWYSCPRAELRESSTKYFRPLLPADSIFQSHCNSNWSYSPSERMSVPFLPRHSNQSSRTTQPLVGNEFCLKLCHPFGVCPSNSNFHPWRFSSGLSWFGGRSAARIQLASNTENKRQKRSITVLIGFKNTQKQRDWQRVRATDVQPRSSKAAINAASAIRYQPKITNV